MRLLALWVGGHIFFKPRQIYVPGQERFQLLKCCGTANAFEDAVEVSPRFELVGLGGFDQRVHGGTGMGASGGVGKDQWSRAASLPA